MKQAPLAIALALTGALTACAPLIVVAGGPAPAATKKPKADDGDKAPKPAASTASLDAAQLPDETKPVMGPDRQAAFVASLHDALPVTLASGGLSALSAAASVVSNNGGGLVANNGGSLISDHGGSVVSNHGAAYRLPFGLLQAAAPPAAASLRTRKDVVIIQRPETTTGGTLSLYDPRTYDPEPGADNAAALVDRFRYELVDVVGNEDGSFSGDLEMTILSSKRIPFVDRLMIRQTTLPTADARGYRHVRFDYFVGFDVALPDGSVDRADLHLTAGEADLVRDRDAQGREIPGTETPGRMAIGGGNGHGTYGGEVRFPEGGTIEVAFTHARGDGARTLGTMALRPDGSVSNEATSEGGRLALRIERAADGRRTFEVRDLEGGGAVVLPGVVTEAAGIGTFDFGAAEKPRARLF